VSSHLSKEIMKMISIIFDHYQENTQSIFFNWPDDGFNMKEFFQFLLHNQSISKVEYEQLESHFSKMVISPRTFKSETNSNLAFTINTDPTGHVITYVSPEIKNVLGIEPTTWMGVKKYVELHPQDYDRAYRQLFKACKSKTSTTSVHRFKHKDGKWIIVEARFIPHLDPTDKLESIYIECYLNTDACKEFEIYIQDQAEKVVKSFHTIKYVENNEILSFHYVSPEIFDILRIHQNKWMGINSRNVDMFGDDQSLLLSVLQQSIQEQREKTTIARFKVGNSKDYVPLEVHFQPIIDPDGRVHKVFTTYYKNTKKCKEFTNQNPHSIYFLN